MSISPGCEGDDSELVETGKLHTRCASPRRLTQELAQLLEGARFMVEMRHNVYHISSTKKFNLALLRRMCESIEATPVMMH